ncbi:MAG: vacuolar family H+-ATPase subunit H [Lachnospiraceae bacterium]|jgi:cell division septum initiation protein DivIVA
MSSRIEELIDEIEEYIDTCKYKAFSTDIIMVNKAEMDDLLRELRMKTPEEIKRYQKVLANTEAILADARSKAEELIKNATAQTTELVNEHEIMQRAYEQANEIVAMATEQAQGILDNAMIEANNMKAAAMQYTDDILANLENILKQSIEISTRDYNTLVGNLQEIDHVVTSNRAELVPANDSVNETPAAENAETDGINVI